MLESTSQVLRPLGGSSFMQDSKRPVRNQILACILLLLAVPAMLAGAEKAGKKAAPAGLFLPVSATKAAQVIDRGALEAPLRFLSDDLLEGRGVASRGDQTARLYLASVLEFLGYQPGAPGNSWQQPVEMVGIKSHAPKVWDFKAGSQSFGLKWWDDYIAASQVQEPTANIKNAELVFVGYGIQAPEYQWDDFKGMNLKGKILVMMNNDPDWDPQLFAGTRRLYYGRWTYKYESAARQGAAGAIIIHTTESAAYPWHTVQSSWTGENARLPAAAAPALQVRAWVTQEAAQRVV